MRVASAALSYTAFAIWDEENAIGRHTAHPHKMMPFACWVFALLMSDSSALSAGPSTRRPTPARPKRFRKLLVPISVGGLAVVELSTSLWEIGHHHGLAMLALSRGAHAVTDLTQSGADAVETVVEVVSEVGAEAAAAVRTHSTRLSRFFTPRRIR